MTTNVSDVGDDVPIYIYVFQQLAHTPFQIVQSAVTLHNPDELENGHVTRDRGYLMGLVSVTNFFFLKETGVIGQVEGLHQQFFNDELQIQIHINVNK